MDITPKQESLRHNNSGAGLRRRNDYKNNIQGMHPGLGMWAHQVAVSFEMTQILTGHGYHKSYLHRFKITDDPLCPCDDSSIQDIMHLLRHCPIFGGARHDHEMTCNNLKINPYKINELLTKSEPTTTFTQLIKTIFRRQKVTDRVTFRIIMLIGSSNF
ncbi:hypothetical protein ABMA28_014825 [Loxostege sticticalis]|uniref:Reverse transcriptase n=1 Tax=Loxostege sticticalis TaxID=481309 RepID=A0ABD0TCX5_LOXSC